MVVMPLIFVENSRSIAKKQIDNPSLSAAMNDHSPILFVPIGYEGTLHIFMKH